MRTRQFNDSFYATRLKHIKTLKCDVDVRMKIKKPNLLHDWLHDVDFTMCKQKKRPSILKYQSNIAPKPATGKQGYSMTQNKHFTWSLVHVRDLSNISITGHALSAKVTLQ